MSEKRERELSFIYHPIFILSFIGLSLFGCFFLGYSEAGLTTSRSLISAGASLVATWLTIHALTNFDIPKSVSVTALLVFLMAGWFFIKLMV